MICSNPLRISINLFDVINICHHSTESLLRLTLIPMIIYILYSSHDGNYIDNSIQHCMSTEQSHSQSQTSTKYTETLNWKRLVKNMYERTIQTFHVWWLCGERKREMWWWFICGCTNVGFHHHHNTKRSWSHGIAFAFCIVDDGPANVYIHSLCVMGNKVKSPVSRIYIVNLTETRHLHLH